MDFVSLRRPHYGFAQYRIEMTTIHHILHAIENNWGLLILFGIVMLHLYAFAMVGIFHPDQIRRPMHLRLAPHAFIGNNLILGGFKWVGFRCGVTESSVDVIRYVAIGFYYIIWSKDKKP